MRTKSGISRQFGFVGFRTEHEAEEAIRYFNKSFMDTCRIICEMGKGHEEKSDEEVADPDGFTGEGNFFLEKQAADIPDIQVHDKVVSDIDYFRSRIKKKCYSESVEGTDHTASDDDDDDDNGDSKSKSNHNPAADTLEPNVSEGKTEDGFGDRSADPSSSPGNKHDEVLESGRLFIRNLPYSATEEELQDHFSKYGTISQVHIVIDKDTRRSMGLAYVLFAIPEAAARALKEMDSSIFQGRLLHVMPAKQKNQSDVPEINNASKTLKQQRISERKESEATGNIRAWNTLFMRPDTIVESIARKYGVSKSELLDRESDDLAVRVALGETQVIAETKKALSNAGVNISSLEEFATGKTDGLKRSNHVTLVKNLPYGSSEGELSEKFGKFGSLDKIILPPTKTLAVVVFLEPAEARAAFKGLAYKRYKDAPLYLEWAPGSIVS